ncbi:MAG: MXAN_5187 C-terminal domain-containing protein [Syntrophotaleaceae bacterium]
MQERKTILKELDLIAQQLRELEIQYEKYFAGEEKRAPLKGRDNLYRRLRRIANRRIIQTDLRFRYESLSARFFSYATHWDRIMRLMDEGRYSRHLAKAGPARVASDQQKPQDEVETVYQQLLQAHAECALAEPLPDRQKFSAFLDRQREALKDKYGGKEIEFRVVSENGKPKIKVKAKSGSNG